MNYCSDCGRPLRDGEVCNCTAGAAAQPQPPYQPAPPEPPVQQPGGFQQQYPPQPGAYQQPVYAPKPPSPLGIFFKTFFKTPNQSTGAIARAATSNPLILGGIYALVCAFYLPLLFGQVLGAVFDAAVKIDPYSAQYIMATRQMISMPNIQFAFTGVLCAAILLLLVALLWMLLGKGPGGALPFKACFAGACAASYPAALLMALSCVVGFASVYFGVLLFYSSFVVLLINSASAMEEVTGVRATWLYGALFFVALMILSFICFQMLNAQVMEISYRGIRLKDEMYVNKFTDIFRGASFFEILMEVL